MKLKEITSLYIKELGELYGPQEARAIASLILEDLGFARAMAGISNKEADASTQKKVLYFLAELKKGRPVQYVLGYAWFYDRKFTVSEHCLIPRQETEELVRHILNENKDPGLNILDLGTGSGNIGITLALELPQSRITCLDLDPEALKIARINAETLGAGVNFLEIDLLGEDLMKHRGKYDLLVSNPPYVRYSESTSMSIHVKDHEPGKALFVPDADPLIFYRAIMDYCRQTQNKGCKLYFEINEAFGKEINDLMTGKGFHDVRIIKDIHEKQRFAAGTNS